MVKNQKPKGPFVSNEQLFAKHLSYWISIMENLQEPLRDLAEKIELMRTELKQVMRSGFAKHEQQVKLILKDFPKIKID